MRIRRKKNLDIRLAALTDYIIPVDDTVKDARLVTRQKDYINLCDVFIKEQPLRIEVGCDISKERLEYAKDTYHISENMFFDKDHAIKRCVDCPYKETCTYSAVKFYLR